MFQGKMKALTFSYVYHHREMDKMFELGEQFLALQPDVPQVYYVWGHAYEFDIHDDWARFEAFSVAA